MATVPTHAHASPTFIASLSHHIIAMTDATTHTPEDIALFLRQHPDFFIQNADIFAEFKLPHPHSGKAISLGERQILTLRERLKQTENTLAGLIHNAKSNDAISLRLYQWVEHLVALPDSDTLADAIRATLIEDFGLQDATVRWWGATPPEDATLLDSLANQAAPAVGSSLDHPAVALLAQPPASVAIIVLRHDVIGDQPAGVLVLGADSADRFTPDMGTHFLATIGALASATLGRTAA